MPTSSVPTIELRDVSKAFGPTNIVFRGFNLKVSPQELLVVMGPSGAGKTTLLKLIGGLILPDSGGVYAEGRKIVQPNPDVITIFQNTSSTLLPWRTALANVRLPLEAGAWRIPDRARQEERARDALVSVGLGSRGGSYPRELSGGMQQRIALARAIVTGAGVLLLDEPFTSLDLRARAEMQKLLLDIFEERGVSIVFITHDIEEAVQLGTRIMLFGKPPITVASSYPNVWSAGRDALRQTLRNEMITMGIAS